MPGLAALLLAATLVAAPPEAFDAAGAQAYADWEHAVAVRLARDGPARDALVAVLFARSAQRGNAPGATATLERAWSRARALGGDDVLVHWLALTRCPAGPAGCDRAAAFARLERLEPDNGAYWRLVLHEALERRDAPRARAALARMARAERFDTHDSTLFAAVDAALAGVPVPAAVRSAGERTLGEDTARGVAAFGVLLANAVPPASSFPGYCAPGSETAFEARREDCIAAAERMASRSDTLVDRAIGVAAWLRAARGTPAEARARAAARDHHWQLEQQRALLAAKEFGDEQAALEEIARRRRYGSELAAMQAELAAAGVPLRAPADFAPAQPID